MALVGLFNLTVAGVIVWQLKSGSRIPYWWKLIGYVLVGLNAFWGGLMLGLHLF